MKTSVIITFQLEGIHNFPAARELFPEVGFLADPHRHMFHFKLAKQVNHDDRDIEFLMFKRQVQTYLQLQFAISFSPGFNSDWLICNFGSRSCEMIAKQLLEKFDCLWVEVWEDGENGARVEI